MPDHVTFSRKDTSILSRWWWTIDKWTFVAILILMAAGVFLSFAASPPVAHRLHLANFHFVKRHIMMVIPSLLLIVGISLMPPRQLRRVSVVLFLFGIILLVLTCLMGIDIKGARRWVNLSGFTIQPSEFVKPVFAVLTGWMLAEKNKNSEFPGMFIAFGLLVVFAGLLMAQPDLGMTIVVTATWIGQLFIAGMPIIWLFILGISGTVGFLLAYLFFPHVTKRVNQFFDPVVGSQHNDLYQINQSLEAFRNGGLFGRGPGEGLVKKHIPDVHADFVFAVAGEEFGFILCLALIGVFSVIVIRCFLRIMNTQSLFVMISVSGLIAQFGMQTLINLGSTLHLIPTKGMTMPFISYGGSSMLALALTMGMILGLTRRRPGQEE